MFKILKFDEINSTNTYAKENAAALADHTVITAKSQLNGRGRFDRKWQSAPGGLYFTILLKPAKTDYLSNLTQLASAAICQTLGGLGVKAHIKWPNDVLVNGQKICGILSEAVIKDGKFYALALGAGVNTNQADLSAAGQPAVSLKMLGVNISNEDVLNSILNNFFNLYDNVIENGFTAIKELYKSSFAHIGRAVNIGAGQNMAGVIKDIDDNGQLVLQDLEGKQHKVLTGEIL